MPYCTSDGAVIHIEDWGEGPPLVFTHGWSAGHEMWEYAMSALTARGFRCIGIDRRGCGRSTSGRRAIDLDLLADDLRGALDVLELRDAVLVAHSMGAAEAARMLTRSEPPLAGLVLVAPTTPALLAGPDNPDGLPAHIRDEIVAGLEADKPAYLATAAPGFFGGDTAVSAELCRWGVALAERASVRTSVALIETLWQADVRAELPAITLPTLIMHGDADMAAPLDLCGRRTAAAIPHSRLEIYPGGPHGLPLARGHKDRLADQLAEFAQAIGGHDQQRT